MKFFGDWGAHEVERCERPVGQPCIWCDEAIGPSDLGALMPYVGKRITTEEPWHRECVLRVIFGSVEHIKHRGLGTCDGKCTDDPSLTRRQAAMAAAKTMGGW